MMHQRQKKILDMLQNGRLNIRSAAAELGVTEMTCGAIFFPWKNGNWSCA